MPLVTVLAEDIPYKELMSSNPSRLTYQNEWELVMTNEQRSLIKDAEKLELAKVHDFGQLHVSTGYRTNIAPSPKRSPAGQWYMECQRCSRVLFEGKTGSAVSSGCI